MHSFKFWAVAAIIALIIILALAPDAKVRGQNLGLSQWIAVDGDTIKSPAGVRYRLLGFDAPETALAKCIGELDLGTKAKRRLQELINTGPAQLIESGKRDKYGRSLATLMIGGRDVAGIMIAEGLGRPYKGGKREGWCGD